MTNVMNLLEMDPADHVQALAGRIVDEEEYLFIRLKEARVNQGLTLNDVASRMGVSTTYVEYIEKRHAEVSFGVLRRYLLSINTEAEFEVFTSDVLWGHK